MSIAVNWKAVAALIERQEPALTAACMQSEETGRVDGVQICLRENGLPLRVLHTVDDVEGFVAGLSRIQTLRFASELRQHVKPAEIFAPYPPDEA